MCGVYMSVIMWCVCMCMSVYVWVIHACMCIMCCGMCVYVNVSACVRDCSVPWSACICVWGAVECVHVYVCV